MAHQAGDALSKREVITMDKDHLVLHGPTPDDSIQPENPTKDDLIMGIQPALLAIGMPRWAWNHFIAKYEGLQKSLKDWKEIIQ